MTTKALFFLVAWTALAAAKPLQAVDYHPNRAFGPGPAHTRSLPGGVEQIGEIVVIEGDDDLVTSDGMGGFGIISDSGQQVLIADRFFTAYPDQFDELVIFTTFDDTGAMGAAAYEISARQDVQGLGTGRPVMDDSEEWGATDHHFAAFVNMMLWSNWDTFGVPITNPASPMYSTLGQEFAHRWLAFLHYTDGSGADSTAMLGRDAAHWASTLQTNASVMDGNQIVDNGDGSFTIVASFARYSPLDLYAMGLLPPSQVPPFFRVANPTKADGVTVIDPAVPNLRRGQIILGTREDITIDQVISANGLRVPAAADSPHAFRVAFAVVTRPGERASDVTDVAAKLEESRHVWEEKFGEYSGGLGTMCTQVSAPCGAPLAQFTGGSVVEAGGNHDGIVDPGESVWVTFQITNTSGADAHDVVVSALGDVVNGQTDATIDLLPSVESTNVPFLGQVPADATCGVPLTIEGESTVGGNTFHGFVQVVPGISDFIAESFEHEAGPFSPNADRRDTATNGWQWGEPQTYRGFGWTFQPTGGHDSTNCWFTGLQAGHRGQLDSSLGTGTSRLWSRPFDVSHTYQPTLRYFTWYQAIDISNPQQLQVASDVPMLVEGSTNGGVDWAVLDTVTGAESSWLERDVPLDGKVPLTRTLVVRFSVDNEQPNLLVEAGIDDLSITTLAPACNPNAAQSQTAPLPAQSSGCDFAARAPLGAAPLAWLSLAALALAAFARRRSAPRR
jgi:hypothetical protein